MERKERYTEFYFLAAVAISGLYKWLAGDEIDPAIISTMMEKFPDMTVREIIDQVSTGPDNYGAVVAVACAIAYGAKRTLLKIIRG